MDNHQSLGLAFSTRRRIPHHRTRHQNHVSKLGISLVHLSILDMIREGTGRSICGQNNGTHSRKKETKMEPYPNCFCFLVVHLFSSSFRLTNRLGLELHTFNSSHSMANAICDFKARCGPVEPAIFVRVKRMVRSGRLLTSFIGISHLLYESLLCRTHQYSHP